MIVSPTLPTHIEFDVNIDNEALHNSINIRGEVVLPFGRLVFDGVYDVNTRAGAIDIPPLAQFIVSNILKTITDFTIDVVIYIDSYRVTSMSETCTFGETLKVDVIPKTDAETKTDIVQNEDWSIVPLTQLIVPDVQPSYKTTTRSKTRSVNSLKMNNLTELLTAAMAKKTDSLKRGSVI